MAEEIKTEVEDAQVSADSSTQEETYTKEQVQKLIDSEISKAVNKYKETSYRKDLEKGISQALEDREKKTPEQIQIEKLQQELEIERNTRLEKERQSLKEFNTKKAMETLSAKGLPVELAELVASSDSDKTVERLNSVVDVLSGFSTKVKQSVIDGSNVRVPSKTVNETDGKPGKDASKDAWKAYYKKNR